MFVNKNWGYLQRGNNSRISKTLKVVIIMVEELLNKTLEEINKEIEQMVDETVANLYNVNLFK